MDYNINFLVDELSGDSDYVDSVGIATGSAADCRDAPDQWAVVHGGQYGQLDDDEDDDRESAVDAGGDDMEDGEVDGGEDGKEVYLRDRDDEDDRDIDVDEDESMRRWAAPTVGHRCNEQMEEEKDERRRISTTAAATDQVEDAKERDRRFWETCLASGYP